jgi:hypothetical protein
VNIVKLKALVRQRDGMRCTKCGMTAIEHRHRYGRALDVHRLDPRSRYTLEGCATVCRRCHGKLPKTKDGRPDQGRGGRIPLNFWLPTDLGQAVRDHLANAVPHISLTAFVEYALQQFLTGRGFWPPKPKNDQAD